MNSEIHVSVCIATYNGEKFIKEQILSILSQIQPDDEIIVSDDNSTDNTLKIIGELNDVRIKVVTNEGRKGVVGNFENALKSSSGKIIFLADQDDVWLPHKVSKCIDALSTYDLVVTNCKVVDQGLDVIDNSYFQLNNSQKGFLKNFYRSSYLGCCLAFRRELLKTILPFPSKLFLYHDWWIGFIADWKYKVFFIEEPCMLFRRHGFNVSNTAATSTQGLFKKVRDRFQLLYLGSIRIIKSRHLK